MKGLELDKAVLAIERRLADKGFRVLHTHDVAATPAQSLLPCEPRRIIKVSDARCASQRLN